ncbi:MAG: class I SAM-dependent methyltransferase [Acidobacteria bacterium]|nr:class I SAM-dependent methyltransferase [Acidobacteriota bacterium]
MRQPLLLVLGVCLLASPEARHQPLLVQAGPWTGSSALPVPAQDGGQRAARQRQIAPVCSDADWLTRPERDETEQPEKVLDALKIPEGAAVADVGAGVGYFTWRLAKRVGPKGRVIAEDLQPKMLELLEENLKKRNVTNVELVLGTRDDPRLPEGALDLALLVDVYHELSEPEAMMRHIRRALKPGGRLVLIEYRKEDPSIPILPLHKMSVAEARAEIEPLGFKFQQALEFLPMQHILIFTSKPASKQAVSACCLPVLSGAAPGISAERLPAPFPLRRAA